MVQESAYQTRVLTNTAAQHSAAQQRSFSQEGHKKAKKEGRGNGLDVSASFWLGLLVSFFESSDDCTCDSPLQLTCLGLIGSPF